MNLDEAQKRKVAGWIAEGLKVSEIQKRLVAELGVQMTYMEVRLLLDDLSLVPKDQPPPLGDKQFGPLAQGGKAGSAVPASQAQVSGPTAKTPAEAPKLGPGKVALNVDAVTQPGTLVSGTVTFSDGNVASWYLDQTGRLGLAPKQQGYRPSPEDIEDFQFELQNELQKLGL